MTVIEVLQPDGCTHVFTSDERSDSAIAQEVDQLYPDATLWRKSNDWRSPGTGKPVTKTSLILSATKTALIIVVLALVLTPIITWIASPGGFTTPLWASFSNDSAPAEAELPAPAGGSLDEDVQIADVAKQFSDTTMTLRVLIRNTGIQAYDDIQIEATFYDSSGAEIPGQESCIGVINLGPGEEGYVKVWSQYAGGIEDYDLAIVTD